MTTMRELLPQYQAALQSRGHRPRGIDRYASQLHSFGEWLGTVGVERVTSKHISRYQAHLAQRYMPASLQVSLSALRSFFQWILEEELRADDPTTKLPWPKRRQTLPDALSRQQLRTLMYTINTPPEDLTQHGHWIWQRNRLVVLVMLRTGVRISEAVALQWHDVDLEQQTLRVRDGKGGKDRTIPLRKGIVTELCPWQSMDEERAVLPAYPDGRSFRSTKSMAHVFDRWLRAHGIKITAHRLRHTFATELVRGGADLESIRRLLGHASLETTQRYLDVDADHLRGAVDHLPEDW